MSQAEFAVWNCQLITLAGPARPRTGAEMREIGVIPDGGLLVRDGRIAAAGKRAEIERLAGGAEVIDAGGRVVLPGFVDAHTHPVFGAIAPMNMSSGRRARPTPRLRRA